MPNDSLKKSKKQTKQQQNTSLLTTQQIASLLLALGCSAVSMTILWNMNESPEQEDNPEVQPLTLASLPAQDLMYLLNMYVANVVRNHLKQKPPHYKKRIPRKFDLDKTAERQITQEQELVQSNLQISDIISILSDVGRLIPTFPPVVGAEETPDDPPTIQDNTQSHSDRFSYLELMAKQLPDQKNWNGALAELRAIVTGNQKETDQVIAYSKKAIQGFEPFSEGSFETEIVLSLITLGIQGDLEQLYSREEIHSLQALLFRNKPTLNQHGIKEDEINSTILKLTKVAIVDSNIKSPQDVLFIQ